MKHARESSQKKVLIVKRIRGEMNRLAMNQIKKFLKESPSQQKN